MSLSFPRNPLSVISALLFIAPGIFALTQGELAVGIAFLLLTLGTAGWHWTRDSTWLQIDRLGMLASLTTLVAWSLPEVQGFLALLAALALLAVYSERTILALIALVVAAALIATGTWLFVIAGLIAIGLAYLAQRRGEALGESTTLGDAYHAAWQLLACIAYVCIELAYYVSPGA